MECGKLINWGIFDLITLERQRKKIFRNRDGKICMCANVNWRKSFFKIWNLVNGFNYRRFGWKKDKEEDFMQSTNNCFNIVQYVTLNSVIIKSHIQRDINKFTVEICLKNYKMSLNWPTISSQIFKVTFFLIRWCENWNDVIF